MANMQGVRRAGGGRLRKEVSCNELYLGSGVRGSATLTLILTQDKTVGAKCKRQISGNREKKNGEGWSGAGRTHLLPGQAQVTLKPAEVWLKLEVDALDELQNDAEVTVAGRG